MKWRNNTVTVNPGRSLFTVVTVLRAKGAFVSIQSVYLQYSIQALMPVSLMLSVNVSTTGFYVKHLSVTSYSITQHVATISSKSTKSAWIWHKSQSIAWESVEQSRWLAGLRLRGRIKHVVKPPPVLCQWHTNLLLHTPQFNKTNTNNTIYTTSKMLHYSYNDFIAECVIPYFGFKGLKMISS